MASCSVTQDSEKILLADHLFHEHDSVLERAGSYSEIVEIKYAKGLKVDYHQDGIHVTISNPDPAVKNAPSETFVITKPASRFICTTALQLGNFETLGLEEYIVGTNSLRNVFSARIVQQMEDGQTVTIGKEGRRFFALVTLVDFLCPIVIILYYHQLVTRGKQFLPVKHHVPYTIIIYSSISIMFILGGGINARL